MDQSGTYRIEREIGRGGMGVVYLATDTALGRVVAIKTLPEHLADDADRLARFQREARALAQLNHPNVATIHGVEQRDDRMHIILEYVDGETLEQRIDRSPLDLDETIEVGLQIASAVAAAHDAGVIHRDLKPGNILV
ncbi:MAG: serine/threonine protein kinase, partial [Phycisphaerales bacterium]|nr:serine/threonine protein kinase [Phycisphaerales bacterium]